MYDGSIIIGTEVDTKDFKSQIQKIEDDLDKYIKLNSKFKLYIGLTNRLGQKYKSEGDILWFKCGTYVFTNASFTHNASSISVSVNAKDKMCLLNGEVGGTIPDTVILHERINNAIINGETVIIYEHPTIF